MAELTVRFDVKFSARMLRWAMAGAMVLAAAPELASESVSLSTYYPAPSGVYTQLIATSNTFLARDGGYLDVGTPATPAVGTKMVVMGGSVGIGTLNALSPANSAFTVDPSGIGTATAMAVAQGGQPVWALNPNGTGGWVMYDGSNGWTGLLQAGGSVGTANSLGVNAVPLNNIALNVGGAINASAYQPNYQSWATYGTGSGGAAIYNDAGTYQTLMLVGNASNGTGRQVSVWDELNVQGNELVAGYQAMPQANCSFVTYTPGTTNCPAGQYATNVSGMDVRWVALGNLPAQDALGGAPGTGEMLCCTCAIIESRFSTAPGDGVGTGPGGCPSF